MSTHHALLCHLHEYEHVEPISACLGQNLEIDGTTPLDIKCLASGKLLQYEVGHLGETCMRFLPQLLCHYIAFHRMDAPLFVYAVLRKPLVSWQLLYCEVTVSLYRNLALTEAAGFLRSHLFHVTTVIFLKVVPGKTCT